MQTMNLRLKFDFLLRRVKIRFDLEQIGTKSFSAIFVFNRCTEQHTKNRGKSNHGKLFFFCMVSKKATIIKKYFILTNAKFRFHDRATWLQNNFSMI